MEITWETILSIAAAVTTIGGAWVTILKIQKSRKESKQAEKQAILAEATAAMDLKEQALKSEIEELSSRIDSIEQSVQKDLEHFQEMYNSEIKNLGEKIENLRTELRNQHGSLVHLLTKLIENKE